MATTSNLMMIALDKIVPSKTNPRKQWVENGLKELSESIKASGVLQPILLRPLNGSGKFEIIAGERRFRAAKLAELPELPAIVRKMGDQEAMELQIVENLQREDVHPLDEANGYRALLDLKGEDKKPVHTAASIAAKVGKS